MRVRGERKPVVSVEEITLTKLKKTGRCLGSLQGGTTLEPEEGKLAKRRRSRREESDREIG